MTDHTPECTIHLPLHPTGDLPPDENAGVCQCGYGWEQMQSGNPAHMWSEELKLAKYQASLVKVEGDMGTSEDYPEDTPITNDAQFRSQFGHEMIVSAGNMRQLEREYRKVLAKLDAMQVLDKVDHNINNPIAQLFGL